MKRNILSIFLILTFFIMLIFPKQVLQGAKCGLLLWFHTILPTLLPFLILTGLLLHTKALHLLVQITSPLLCPLFGVTKYGSFAVLCGFLCGYPMGGKITSDLLNNNKISLTEARYLLSFCNNTSPMFIISYVMHQNLKAPQLMLPALGVLFLSPVLCSFIFRCFYPVSRNSYHINQKDIPKDAAHPVNLLDECIMSSFESITKIGGYIILFSIIIQLLSALPVTHSIFEYGILPSLEITNGVFALSKSMIPLRDRIIIILSLVSFGGWCSVAQTKCMISGTGIPLFPYIIEKLITSAVTSFLAYVFFTLY